MNIQNNAKHNKYGTEWTENIKRWSLLLDKKADPNKKSEQLQTLFTERDKLVSEQTDLQSEIRKLATQQKKLLSIASYVREADNEHTRLTTHSTTHNPRMNNFLGTGAGTKWRTNGWLKNTENHFTPSTGKLDNLYKVQISGVELETTEEQIINTIAFIVHSLKKVDLADFTTKYNAKESDTVKQGKVHSYLTKIQTYQIIVGSSQDASGKTKQPSYDFANTYDNSSPKPDYQEFFEFIELTHNQPFLKDLDADKQKDVAQPQSWQIFQKGEAYTKEQLAWAGINIDQSKTSLYKTGKDTQTILPSEKGIAGWLELAHSITYSDDNKTKIVQAFNNSPNQHLFEDLKTWTTDNKFTTDSTNWTLPEITDEIETIKDQLEMERLGSAVQLVELKKQTDDKRGEITAKQSQITQKETEIDTIVAEILTKKRQKLKDYHIEKGFKNANNEDNRRDIWEIFAIQKLLLEIRYLENDGDATKDSSVSQENEALVEVSELWEDFAPTTGKKISLISYFENQLAFAGSDKKDIQQAISRIKAGKYTDNNGQEQKVYYKLEEFKQHFEEKEKFVKLDDWEQKALTAIKIALGKKEDPTDTLQTYQSKLKALDPLLDEAIITQAVIDDWKTQNNFQTASTMEAEIKKVFKNHKLDEEFAQLIKKADAEITDIANLFKKKPAKDIIILIRRWEYEQNPDKDKRKKLVWTLELKDDQGKYLDDKELTEEEINQVLYDIAIGNKTLATKKKEDEIDNPQQTPPDKKFFRTDNAWMWITVIGIPLLIGGLVWYFWDQLFGKTKSETNEDEEDAEPKEQVEI